MPAVPRWTNWARGSVLVGGVAFVASLLYFAYVYFGRFGDPVDPSLPRLRPTLVNIALFSAFAFHHSAFARVGLKDAIARLVSPDYERSVYVWASSLLFAAVCSLWQGVPGTLWTAPAAVQPLMLAAQGVGAGLAVFAASKLDVLELAGLRQATTRRAQSVPALLRSGPYAVVRHPVYLGWIMLVWVTPEMTGTRLVFAAVSTLYLALAVPFEERDLSRLFGPGYADYKREVRWRMLPFVY